MKTIANTIQEYNKLQNIEMNRICNLLEKNINENLKKSESKIWHGSPVWFIEGNPIVSYSIRKGDKVALMFFSGQSFEEKDLTNTGKFKAAEIIYLNSEDIKEKDLKRWLKKSIEIQWNYKNIIKNKGLLEKINK